MFDGYFDFGSLCIDILSMIAHLNFADVPQKLIMNQDEQTFIELEPALVLLFDNGHGHNIVPDTNWDEFVVRFYHISHYLSESFIIKDN